MLSLLYRDGKQLAVGIERLAGSQGDGNHQREHGGGKGDDHNHHLVFDGDIRTAATQYLPNHGARKSHQSHDGDVGYQRAERLDDGLADEGGLCLRPGGAVAEEVSVQLLLPLQSAVVGIEGYDVAGEHVSHQYAEYRDEILGAEHVLQLQDHPDEVHAHAYHAAQKPHGDGNEQHPPFQPGTCQCRLRSYKDHDNHPQEVYPRVVPQEQVFQVDADEEQLDNHPCRADEGGTQQSGLELPNVKQRYQQQQKPDAQAKI